MACYLLKLSCSNLDPCDYASVKYEWKLEYLSFKKKHPKIFFAKSRSFFSSCHELNRCRRLANWVSASHMSTIIGVDSRPMVSGHTIPSCVVAWQQWPLLWGLSMGKSDIILTINVIRRHWNMRDRWNSLPRNIGISTLHTLNIMTTDDLAIYKKPRHQLQ